MSAESFPRFVSLHERDISELIKEFPKLARAEVLLVIERHGPGRDEVLRELERLSLGKY